MIKNTVTLKLTLSDLGIILGALMKLPFEEVVDLLGDIGEQAERQLADSTTPSEPVAEGED